MKVNILEIFVIAYVVMMLFVVIYNVGWAGVRWNTVGVIYGTIGMYFVVKFFVSKRLDKPNDQSGE